MSDMAVIPENLIIAEKWVGETPLECLSRYRKLENIDDSTSMTYAGRLDPLASGVLPLLVGDLVHEKEKFTTLDKQYWVEILVGVSTDTFDIIGIPTNLHPSGPQKVDIHELEETLGEFIGEIKQAYPPYSSKTVGGKQLWQWAREGKLDQIEIPTHEVQIHNISDFSQRVLSTSEVVLHIEEVLSSISGDFRQSQVMSSWKEVLVHDSDLQIIKFSVTCGSGTYIRQLVQDLGEKAGVSMCVYNLKRTKVGSYTQEKPH